MAGSPIEKLKLYEILTPDWVAHRYATSPSIARWDVWQDYSDIRPEPFQNWASKVQVYPIVKRQIPALRTQREHFLRIRSGIWDYEQLVVYREQLFAIVQFSDVLRLSNGTRDLIVHPADVQPLQASLTDLRFLSSIRDSETPQFGIKKKTLVRIIGHQCIAACGEPSAFDTIEKVAV